MDKIDFPAVPDLPDSAYLKNIFKNTYARIGVACLILMVVYICVSMGRRRSVKVVYVHGKGTPVSVGGFFRDDQKSPPAFRAMHGISFGCSVYIDTIQRITQGREFDLFSIVARPNPSKKQQSGFETMKIARVWMDGITNDVHIKE